MTETETAVVLDHLRGQFARVHARFDRLEGDVAHPKVRMSAVENDGAYTRLGMAELNGRLGRIDARIDWIERRLELIPAE